MTEYKNTDFESRSRYVRRLKSKAAQKARFQIFGIVAGIAFAIVLLSILAINLFSKAKVINDKKVPDKPLESILVLGIEQKEFDQYTTGFSIVVFNPNEEQINVMKFDPETKVLIPGYGFDSIDKSLFGGVDSALATASNVTGVAIDKYITLNIDDYKKAISPDGTNTIFKKIFNTNLESKDQVRLAKDFKSIKEDSVSVLEVPVTKLKVGNIYSAQPKKDKLKELIEILWGEKVEQRTKVILLNGMGKTGICGKIGQKLIRQGYEVLDIKNAKSFNYKTSIIALYTLDKKKDAEEIKKIIKVGKIEPSAKGQNYTDITVIIGKDYR